MEDLYEPYNPTPNAQSPDTAPTEPSKRNFRKIWIGVLAAVAVIALIAAGVYLLRRSGVRQSAVQLPSFIEQTETVCNNASDKERCMEEAVISRSLANSDASVCGMLEGASADTCLSEVAVKKRDVSACDAVSDSQRKSECADEIRIVLASETKNIELCDVVSTEEKQHVCRDGVFETFTASECYAASGPEQLCFRKDVIERAIESNDPRVCLELIEVEDATLCRSALPVTDWDSDGLNNIEEAHYGTSDLNADSDNDGFADGSEVENGFNPNGPGSL